ncbi:MAG: hypothetical protein R3330_14425, partial [Saprospiraceae bacterium]|nr:hypothetical protein [Saprospiraceae bacterium]
EEQAILHIDILDNGNGFDPTQSSPASVGIEIVRQRLANLGPQASLDISNRTDGAGRTFGARVHIVIPVEGPHPPFIS